MGRRRITALTGLLIGLLLVVGVAFPLACGKKTVVKEETEDGEDIEKEEEQGKKEDDAGDSEESVETLRIYLFSGETPVAVERDSSGDGARKALELLLEGPTTQESERGLITVLPEGTRLLEYSEVVEGGKRVAVADFSEEMLEYGGGAANVEAIESQITETIKANDPDVEEVKILVNGVPAEEVLQP